MTQTKGTFIINNTRKKMSKLPDKLFYIKCNLILQKPTYIHTYF